MLLAIDTSTRWASLALYDLTGLVAETSWRCWGNHTVEVLPTIAQMVKRSRALPADIKAVAVAKGPGSFTGLRIGMSIAKGFSLALNVPIIAIPTLDIIAYAVGDPGKVVLRRTGAWAKSSLRGNLPVCRGVAGAAGRCFIYRCCRMAGPGGRTDFDYR